MEGPSAARRVSFSEQGASSMTNFFITNPVIFDNEAAPLHGFLEFTLPGTTQPKNVFDLDGQNLGHKVITNASGMTQQQLFLDGAYDVHLWKFTGTIFDIDDPTQFTKIRTDRIVDPVAELDIHVEGATSFDTMGGLREYSDYHQGDTCILTGYYKGGDISPVLYHWDSTCTENDDGGFYINPDGHTGDGRWVMSPGSLLDVRWWGVKAASIAATVEYNSSGMTACILIANRTGKIVYFPNNGTAAWYGFDSVDFSVSGDVLLDKGVRLMAKDGTSNKLSCRNLDCDRDAQIFYGSGWEFHADDVWSKNLDNVLSWSASRILYYNAANTAVRTLSGGQRVFFITGSETNTILDNVRIMPGSTQIANPVICRNMDIHTDWFVEDYSSSIPVLWVNCSLSLKNCRDAKEYVAWYNSMSLGTDYGDLEGGDITGCSIPFGMTVRNATGAPSFFGNNTIYDSKITIASWISGTLKAVRSNITFPDSDITITSLSGSMFEDCTLLPTNSSKKVTFSLGLSCTRCDVRVNMDVLNGTCTMTDCTINAQFHVKQPIMTRCTIRNMVDQRYGQNEISFLFSHCTFETGSGKHYVGSDSSHSNAVVSGAWLNNVARSTMPIVLDRTYLAIQEESHNYRYEGNTGEFIPKAYQLNTTVKLFGTQAQQSQYPSMWYMQGSNGRGYGHTGSTVESGDTRVTDTTKYAFEFQVFSITGFAPMFITADSRSFLGSHMGTTKFLDYRMFLGDDQEDDRPAAIVNMGGYTWRCTDTRGAMVLVDYPSDEPIQRDAMVLSLKIEVVNRYV